MTTISRWLLSPKLALFLLIIFAGAMAIATFIENDFGTQTAWVLVYNSKWFELVMFLLGVSFVGNIYKYRLWRKEKVSILLFHIAFIVMLLGAGLTRYTSYGGVIRIREGQSSNTIISDKNYLQIEIKKNNQVHFDKKELYLSPLQDNDFSFETTFNDQEVNVTYKDFIADAAPLIIDDAKDGIPMLELVVSSGNGRETIYLKKGEIQKIGSHQHQIGFDINAEGAISIYQAEEGLKIKAPHPLDFFVMQNQSAGKIKQNQTHDLTLKTLYRSGDFSFVPLTFHPKGKIDLISTTAKPKDNDKQKEDVLVVEVAVGDLKEEVNLLYQEGFLPLKQSVKAGDLDITLSYGAVPIKLPFALYLDDFQLERYPGSSSPSSYASEVTVIDTEQNFPYRIFMNNVLDHAGYRFFQASYDTDKKGTVLSVSHDRPGTLVSYFGYFLMGLGMFWTLFGKGSRFHIVNKKLKSLKMHPTAAVLLLILFLFPDSSLAIATKENNLVTVLQSQQIDKEHASHFGRLMVQDLDGRIKPVNTLASEFIRKISRRPYYKYSNGKEKIVLDANQAFLAIHANPTLWQDIPLIKIDKKKGGNLFKDLLTTKESLVSFNALLDAQGNYILEKAVAEANAKKPAERNEFDKQILLVDERFNILFNVFSGNYLKIFPKKDDYTKTWYSYSNNLAGFPLEDAEFVNKIMPSYFKNLALAKVDNDWSKAKSQLDYIKLYQEVLAKEIMPDKNRTEAELIYNQLNLNFWLFQFFWTTGALLLVVAVTRIFYKNKNVIYLLNFLLVVAFVGFIFFTANIILRWYIAQHAPWSNGYEMIVFVSWALFLCGILVYKKSDFVLPLASLFSGTLLFVSYLDWLNPEITNLMPVLKSYWLKIHVAVIVSSYAPLALSAILGMMALLLMIFKDQKHAAIIELKIKELTYINELSMTIGLFLLAIGTFLGGVWANESWGRYWAWDPKETWALISTIIYAAVLHLRLVPKLRNQYVLNVASVLAFSSIVMTSFGVNYYLSGLHSYASGDPVPIPNFVFITVGIIITIMIVAYFRNKRDDKFLAYS